MKIENFTRLVQERPRDARVTTATNKYGNQEAKAGQTSGGRFVAWVKDRKEYQAQNQTARTEFAQSLRETYGEGFDVRRLAGKTALTVRDVAVWIRKAEVHAEKIGRQNEAMAKTTVEDFDGVLKLVAREKGYKTPVHPKVVEAVRTLVERTIAGHPVNLPPIGEESARRIRTDLIGALIDGFRDLKQNADGSLHFTDRPLLDRIVGFAQQTSLTGTEFSRILEEIASNPVDPHDKTLPQIHNHAVASSGRILEFLHGTDFGDADSLCRNVKELLRVVGTDMEQASKINDERFGKGRLDPDQTTAFFSTAIATGIQRLDDNAVAELSKTLKSRPMRDLLGLLGGIGAGFPQNASGRTFYEYKGEDNIIAKKTQNVLESIISCIAKHPASGSFTTESVKPTSFHRPDDVPGKMMEAAKRHQGFGDGVLRQM